MSQQVSFQSSSSLEWISTFHTIVIFFSFLCMSFGMSLQVSWLRKLLFAFLTFEILDLCMGEAVCLKMSWLYERFLTTITSKRLFASVDNKVNFQLSFCFVSFGRDGAPNKLRIFRNSCLIFYPDIWTWKISRSSLGHILPLSHGQLVNSTC